MQCNDFLGWGRVWGGSSKANVSKGCRLVHGRRGALLNLRGLQLRIVVTYGSPLSGPSWTLNMGLSGFDLHGASFGPIICTRTTSDTLNHPFKCLTAVGME